MGTTERGHVRQILAVIVIASTGCTSMQVQWGPPALAVPKEHPSHIRVTSMDGAKRDVYDGDVVGDSLVGYGAPVGGTAQLDRIALAMADLKGISRPVPDAGRTAALAGVLLVGTVVVIAATTKCFIGTWDRRTGRCQGGSSFGLDGI